MKPFSIAINSLKHYLKSDLVIAIGVAAATAVLTGALIVGDSMRTSLRNLTLERLGEIDEMLISQGFFREKLATEIQSTPAFGAGYAKAIPAILFPGGTVEYQPSDVAARAGQVSVIGIRNSFWEFDTSQSSLGETDFRGDVAIINQTLADDLGVEPSQVDAGDAFITIRIPKQTQLPSETALGKKTDLIESLVDLKITRILPTEGLGRFSLFPSQSDPMNVFVPIGILQDKLGRSVLKHKSDPEQANVLLLAGKNGKLPSANATSDLRNQMRPTLEDYGLSLKRVTQTFGKGDDAETVFDYWSLSSDRMILTNEAVQSIANAFPNAKPVMTYLANDIKHADADSGVPFSMVTGIRFDDAFQLMSVDGSPIPPLGDRDIVLSEWTANDLNLKVGDPISVTYFLPETTHGSNTEATALFELAGICKLTEPGVPFKVPPRGPLKPAIFDERPTRANDPDLTPEVPGVTDAQTIKNWDLPFMTKGIRPIDEDYWDYYRTTPKAYVALGVGQQLWGSRFGRTTSFQLPITVGDQDTIAAKLLDQFAADEAKLDMHLVAIKRRGLAASSGSTPFDVLFMALSMFVIGSALILVSLLFRLGLQQRANEVGILEAVGFRDKQVRRLWLNEMSLVCLLGAVFGILLGIGYAWLMIKGLTTWWVGAISRPFLKLHVSPMSLIFGLLSGILICVATIWWSLRKLKDRPVRSLLHGQLESPSSVVTQSNSRFNWLVPALLTVAVGLAIMATQLSGEAQAGSFMGAGFLVLTALLMLVYRWLKSDSVDESEGLSTGRLALMSAKRNPLRSTLTIGLVAVASFLIAAVSAFRLAPTDEGTAGFDWIATSSQPVFENLGTAEGQKALLGRTLDPGTRIFGFRFKPGEDASCNNLYQSTQPRALGVPTDFVHSFDPSQSSDLANSFAWGGYSGGDGAIQANPWQLLNGVHDGTADDPIPVILDKNTANYSLKIFVPGTVREVQYDTGEAFHYKAVGFLANTILQGSLLMSEENFQQAFPGAPGYRYFLIDDSDQSNPDPAKTVSKLEDRLGDLGFDGRSATQILSNFMAVQNTYLSTFQMLGALGLLLGTFGLAAVQIRSVIERTKELGLMRAVGFGQSKLSRMVLLENAWLLFLGLAVGIGAALFTTVPHWLVGSASVPWASLGMMFGCILLVGLIAAWLASRNISKLPLLDSLRA